VAVAEPQREVLGLAAFADKNRVVLENIICHRQCT
jgi:hypothetical protein